MGVACTDERQPGQSRGAASRVSYDSEEGVGCPCDPPHCPTISPALPASPLRSHRKERRDDSRLHLDAGRGQTFRPASLPYIARPKASLPSDLAADHHGSSARGKGWHCPSSASPRERVLCVGDTGC